MEITEIKLKMINSSNDRLRAFCNLTIDNCFVIRELKVVEGTNGVFVAMPSRKIMERCPHCGYKNHLQAKFCNECGKPLESNTIGISKLHTDIAHPINSQCRELIQNKVREAFEKEKQKSTQANESPTV